MLRPRSRVIVSCITAITLAALACVASCGGKVCADAACRDGAGAGATGDGGAAASGSSSGSGSGGTGTGPVDAGQDARPAPVVDASPASCLDESSAIWLAATTPRPFQNACTAAQIPAYYAACVGVSSTTASCKAFTDVAANKACDACITGGPLADGGKNDAFPVILPADATGTRIYANLVGCGYLALGMPECVSNACNFLVCTSSSCSSCGFSSAAFVDCQAAAGASVCRDATETAACKNAYAAGKATVDARCRGTDFAGTFTKVATLLCGPL
jgi:hypothetical protein